MRWPRTYHEPEDLGPEQDRRDAAFPNRRFYVYVLHTDYGHYVGHTARVEERLREHLDGESASTAGGNPYRVWLSGPFMTRREAASFEAALKSLRDQRAAGFREITGLDPIPFAPPARRRRRLGGYRWRRPVRVRRRGRYGGFGRRRYASRSARRLAGTVAVALVLLLLYAVSRLGG